jgi:STE24 endopeptidase
MITFIFLAALAGMTLIRYVLATRQLTAVQDHRDAVPEPFAESIALADHRKAADYTTAKLRLARLELLWEAVVLFGLTIGGGLAAIDALVGGLVSPGLWHGVLTLAALAVVMSVLGMPFEWYSTFDIEARFGFNRMTLRLYLLDLLRSTLIAATLGLPLLALLVYLMQAAGSRWWLYAWAAWVGFAGLLTYAWPRFIAPLFNQFRPLETGPMRDAVETVLRRCGFAADGVYVMDGSKRSSHGNAYFTGFGRTKRIVLFDTLLERLEPSEVEAVLAHELGHFRLHHIRSRLLVTFGTALAGFYVLGLAAASPRFYVAFGVPTPSPAAALALFALVLPVFLFPIGPLQSLWSRRHEYQADRFAAAHANGAKLASALVKLYRDNASTLTPDRWYSAWHDSHPPALARITALSGPH